MEPKSGNARYVLSGGIYAIPLNGGCIARTLTEDGLRDICYRNQLNRIFALGSDEKTLKSELIYNAIVNSARQRLQTEEWSKALMLLIHSTMFLQQQERRIKGFNGNS